MDNGYRVQLSSLIATRLWQGENMEVNRVICGNVLEVLKTFPDESIDCIITSPPYYGKRDYGNEAIAVWGGDPNCEHEWDQNGFCKKCGAWKGELGLEPSPQLYVEHLLQITAELKRVLKKTGTFFLNINDTFSQTSGNGMRQKSMALIPERLLIGLYDQGWYVRNKIIWVKSNSMPESTRDRLSNRYEHVFFLTKSKRYYFDLDSIRVPSISMNRNYTEDKIPLGKEYRQRGTPFQIEPKNVLQRADKEREYSASKYFTANRQKTASPGGRAILVIASGKLTTEVRKKLQDVNSYLKNKLRESGYSVKELAKMIGIKETTLAHYFRTDLSGQAIPDRKIWELMKPILNLGEYDDYIKEEIKSALPQPHPLGKNPGDILETATEPFGREFCPNCKRFLGKKEVRMADGTLICGYCGTPVVSHFAVFPKKLITPLITAGCPPGGVVLDPFCGSGTALVVAKELGRKYIGIDAVRAYCDMAEARLKETKVVVKLTSF